MENIANAIANLTAELNLQIAKNQRGNKAAGARARKITFELAKMYKDFRRISIDAANKAE